MSDTPTTPSPLAPADLYRSLEGLHTKHHHLEGRVADIQTQVAVTNARLDQFAEQDKRLETQIESLRSTEIRTLQNDVGAVRSDMHSIERAVSKLESSVKTFTTVGAWLAGGAGTLIISLLWGIFTGRIQLVNLP